MKNENFQGGMNTFYSHYISYMANLKENINSQ